MDGGGPAGSLGFPSRIPSAGETVACRRDEDGVVHLAGGTDDSALIGRGSRLGRLSARWMVAVQPGASVSHLGFLLRAKLWPAGGMRMGWCTWPGAPMKYPVGRLGGQHYSRFQGREEVQSSWRCRDHYTRPHNIPTCYSAYESVTRVARAGCRGEPGLMPLSGDGCGRRLRA